MSEARDFGKRPELTWLPVDRLDVDPAYQRSLDTPGGKKLVAKIVAEFRWASFQAILATPAAADGHDGRWLIIDGQHRVRAARLLGLALVPAVVIHDASPADQATAFVGANRDRVPVTAQALFYARLVAGDAEAATLHRLCAASGVTLLRYALAANATPPMQTSAVPALLYALRTYGAAHTAAAIAAVAESFGHEKGGLRAPFFRTAARFLSEAGSAAELRAALRRVGRRRLEGAGVGLNGSAMIPAMLAILRGPLPLVADPPALPPGPPASGRPAVRFADDPRAVRDPGSREHLRRPEPFGRSPNGSSLA